MHHRFTELDVFIGRDRAQVLDLDRVLERRRAALHLDRHLPPDVTVEHVLEREELRYRFAVDRNQNIAGRQQAVGRGTRLHVVHHQHAGELWVRGPHPRLGVGIQPEPPEFIVGRVLEHGFQGAARHRLAGIDVLQRAHHRSQWQIKT